MSQQCLALRQIHHNPSFEKENTPFFSLAVNPTTVRAQEDISTLILRNGPRSGETNSNRLLIYLCPAAESRLTFPWITSCPLGSFPSSSLCQEPGSEALTLSVCVHSYCSFWKRSLNFPSHLPMSPGRRASTKIPPNKSVAEL